MATARTEELRTGTVLIGAQVCESLEHRARFRELVQLLVLATHREPGIIGYSWCSSADPSLFVALEGCVDEQGLFDRRPGSRDLIAHWRR